MGSLFFICNGSQRPNTAEVGQAQTGWTPPRAFVIVLTGGLQLQGVDMRGGIGSALAAVFLAGPAAAQIKEILEFQSTSRNGPVTVKAELFLPEGRAAG